MRDLDSTTLERALWSLVIERQDLMARMEAKDLGMELMRLLIAALPDPR